MRYVQATNFGHGFITHADREILSFSGKPGGMWEIDGPDGAIDIWIAKVSGIEKTLVESEALQFEVTKFLYSTREFFTEALTPNEAKLFLEKAITTPAVRNVLLKAFDGNIDVSQTSTRTGLIVLRDNGVITTARGVEIMAGRVA